MPTNHWFGTIIAVAGGALAPSAPTPSPSPATVQYAIKRDSEVMRSERPPHDGVGMSTAYRYFDELEDAHLAFRKRALHPGASIGTHVLSHDEVYYLVSGRGELTVNGTNHSVESGTAIFLREGADVGIAQTGPHDLVLIIAYPIER